MNMRALASGSSGYVDSYDMAAAYLEEKNMKQVNWWNTQGDKAYANYTNAGC